MNVIKKEKATVTQRVKEAKELSNGNSAQYC